MTQSTGIHHMEGEGEAAGLGWMALAGNATQAAGWLQLRNRGSSKDFGLRKAMVLSCSKGNAGHFFKKVTNRMVNHWDKVAHRGFGVSVLGNMQRQLDQALSNLI